MQPRARGARFRAGGFTLVELLVALVAMALMALMGWRGMDSMLRSQQYTQAHTDAHAVLQTALAQWSADLDGLMALEHTQAIAWDGLTLRMTRRYTAAPEAGALVVAWARRTSQGSDQWLRWQSQPVRTRSEWTQAWNQAAQWARNPSDDQRRNETALFPLAGWSIYFHRDGAWSNPLSSDSQNATGTSLPNADPTAPPNGNPNPNGVAVPNAIGRPNASNMPVIPDGVRLQLELAPGAGLAGRLTRDWVNPLRQNSRT